MVYLRNMKEDTCIHCKTMEESRALLRGLEMYGYRWLHECREVCEYDIEYDIRQKKYDIRQKDADMCFSVFPQEKTVCRGTVLEKIDNFDFSELSLHVPIRDIGPDETILCATMGDFVDVMERLDKQGYSYCREMEAEWYKYKANTCVRVTEEQYVVVPLSSCGSDMILHFTSLITEEAEENQEKPEMQEKSGEQEKPEEQENLTPSEEKPVQQEPMQAEEMEETEAAKVTARDISALAFLTWTKEYEEPKYWQMMFGVDSLAEAQEKYRNEQIVDMIFHNGMSDDAINESFYVSLAEYAWECIAELDNAYSTLIEFGDEDGLEKQMRLNKVQYMFGDRIKLSFAIAKAVMFGWNDMSNRRGNVLSTISRVLDSPEEVLAEFEG